MTSATPGLLRLANASVIYVVGNVLSRGLAFVLLPLYTRHLSPTDYGIVAVTLTIVSVLSVVLPLGLHGASARFYFATPDTAERRTTNGTIWMASIVSAGALALLLDRFGSPLFEVLFPAVSFDPYVRLGIWAAFLSVIGLVPLSILQAQERPQAYVLLSLFSSVATAATIVVLVVWRNEGAYGYLRGAVLGGLVAAGPIVVLTARTVSRRMRLQVLLAALAYGVPLVPHALAGWALELSDRAILARFVRLEEVGVYALGYQLGAAVGIVGSAFNSAWVPIFFGGLSRDDPAAERELARLATYFIAAIFFGYLAWALLCQQVIGWALAPGYGEAYRITRLVVIAYALNALYILPVNVLFWKRTTWQIPLITGAAGAVNVALNLILIPRFGVIAAAWNTIAGYLVLVVMAWFLAQRERRFPFEYGRLARIAAVAATLFGAGLAAAQLPKTAATVLQLGIVLLFPLVLMAVRVLDPGQALAAVRKLPLWRRL